MVQTTAHRFISLLLLLVILLLGCAAPEIGDPSPAGSSAPQTSSDAPATLRMAALRARQKAPGHDFATGADGALGTWIGRRGAEATVTTTDRGVRIERGFALGIETTGVGRGGGSRGARTVVERRAEGQELVLEHDDGVEERYLAGPLGLEQSWVLRERPAGSGPLAIEVAFEGLAPETAGRSGGAARRGGAREGRLRRSRGRRRRGAGGAGAHGGARGPAWRW